MSTYSIAPYLSLVLALMVYTAATAQEEQRPEKLAVLPEVPQPADNALTAAKTELGKQLFFDPRLSGDNRMSCATCHLPDKGFGDGLKRSPGNEGKPLTRNSQTLLNVGYYSTFFWDGRATSLEEQALIPIQSAVEMNQDIGTLVEELSSVPAYVASFRAVFHRPIHSEDIAKALSAFERTLVTRNSAFDRYLAGDSSALSAQARRGLELFEGDAGCIRCHNGAQLSDGKYYRLGVGGKDRGRAGVTQQPEDQFKFRTPSLRDIERTAPYMHDGSLATLHDVVEFYYRGIPARGPEGLELDVEPLLGQSFSEIDELVAFLKSLTGEPLKVVKPKLP